VPSSYVTMPGTLIPMAFGAKGRPLSHVNGLGAIRVAYPSDPAKGEEMNRRG
jgi:hypothetical protein